MSDNKHKAEHSFQIGDLAKQTGKSARALRMYEEMGLLHPAARSSGGYRLYDRTSIDRVAWIESLKALGFSLTDVCDLVAATQSFPVPKVAMAEIRARFHARLGEVTQQLETLRQLKEELSVAVDYLDGCSPCDLNTAGIDACAGCATHVADAPRLVKEVTGVARAQQSSQPSTSPMNPVRERV